MVLMGKDCLSSALTMEQGSCSYSLQAADSSKVTEQLNDSLYQLHKPRGRPSLQVVFFHGFQLGGYENAHLSAWTCKDGSRVWPQTWLVEKYPEAHILSVSYSLGLMKSAKGGSVDMYIMGENLLKDLLQQDTGQELHCPMVLVGHSFGGLVIKQLCLQAHKRRSTRIFLENLKGVFFYGTPHHGIPFESAVSLFMNQDPLLEYVKLLSTPTSRLNYEFENLRTEFTYTWRVAGVGENLPTELGRFKRSVVVPEASARYGDFSVVINADHITICRPSTEISTGFQSLISLLRQIHDPSQNTSLVGGAESPRAFEGSGGLLADDWQRPKIYNKGAPAVTTAIRERHKQEMTYSCYRQHLTVSCTPEPSPSSSSQAEYISKYSTRQAVGDSHVTIPRKREVQLVRTGADKRISMRTVYRCGLSDYNEDSISLKVSAYTSLTCCLKCDSDDKKVRIEFSTIGGEVKVEDNVNPKTNTVVLKSVRCNVDACIIHGEGTDDFEPIRLYVQESDGQCPWRRVLQTYELFDDTGQPKRQDDLLWMNLAESHPKNSEPGSTTLELQCHVENRIHYDSDRCCHYAHALQFAERDPVILEGDIFEDLKSNILLELNVRYQAVISYNEPRLPEPGEKFVVATRKDETVDFDCVLEFRTRKFSSLESLAVENVYFHDLEGSHVLGP